MSAAAKVAIVLPLFLVIAYVQPAMPCSGSDCVQYDISSQATCKEVTESATRDCRWVAGLNTNVDQIVLNGQIIAYQIRWLSGKWSQWFVKGVNDIGWTFRILKA